MFKRNSQHILCTICILTIFSIILLLTSCPAPDDAGTEPTASPPLSEETPEPTEVPTESPEPTPEPTETPIPTETPTPVPTPDTGTVGSVWFVPYDQTVTAGNQLNTEIHVNTGTQFFAAYGIDITYDFNIISFVSHALGAEGFVSAVNTEYPGIILTAGFDAMGKGPSSDLHLLTINWDSVSAGETTLGMTVNDLSNGFIETIGTPTGNDGRVIVE